VRVSDDLPLPGDKPKGPSFTRVAIWVIVGGIGAYMVISGIVGMIVKGG